MAGAAAAEMVPFNHTGKPFTDRRALHIDHLPHGENIDFDLGAGFQPIAFAGSQPEFPQTAAGRCAGLGEMTRHGWFATPADDALLFETDVNERWPRGFAVAGIDVRLLTAESGNA